MAARSARPVSLPERCWRWSLSHRSTAALVLLAAAALVSLVAMVLSFNRRLAQELEQTSAEHQRAVAATDVVQRTLTQEVAERLDSDLRELAAVPLTMATLLENRSAWDEKQLEQAMRDLLDKAPLVFGLCVAMEPFAWRADREDFALYVYRRPRGIAVRQLLPPCYQPNYRQWQWYRVGETARLGRWSEPYVGPGGDNTPMVTYSAPIRRAGRFAGVVTADLAVDYFQKLRSSIEGMDVGPTGYCLVISSGNRILAHPDSQYVFPSLQSDLDATALDGSFRALLQRMRHEAGGSARAVDFATGEPADFQFSRVSATGWTLVIVRP